MPSPPRGITVECFGFQRTAYLHSGPDSCPLCHRHVVPHELGFYGRGRDTDDPIEVVYKCTNNACSRLFIGIFRKLSNPSGPNIQTDRPHFGLSQVVPTEPEPVAIPPMVAEISESFAVTYQQALAATAHHLDQLTGIGLRKALEFLVKDYAVHKHPEAVDEIQAKSLSVCIGEYLTDSNVKRCAKRATWLGNDETHYVRRWQDKDIEDLKILIRLTLNWLENVLLTEKYADDMPDPSEAK